MATFRKIGWSAKEKEESDKPKGGGGPYNIMQAREERVQGERNQKQQRYERE